MRKKKGESNETDVSDPKLQKGKIKISIKDKNEDLSEDDQQAIAYARHSLWP